MPEPDYTHNWLTCLEEMAGKHFAINIRTSKLRGEHNKWQIAIYTSSSKETACVSAPTLPEAVIGAWEKVRANFKNSDKND